MYLQIKSRTLEIPYIIPRKVHEIYEVAALQLHEKGHIIFFKDLKDVIIMNPNWFGSKVIGPIFSITHDYLDVYTRQPITNIKENLKRESFKYELKQSFNERKKAFKKILKEISHIEVEDVVHVMMKMNIYYKEYCGRKSNNKRIFILAILRDKANIAHEEKCELVWSEISTSPYQSIVYIGCCLKFEDQKQTFFTQGFFPRVQISCITFVSFNR